MIPARELRIGNWISSYAFINDGAGKMYESEIRKVQADADLIKFIDSEKFATYNPIPLTPEILSACGYIPDPDFGKFENVTARGIFTVNFKNNGFQMDNHFEIKFLHQLQNYHFCIYGTELEYKP